MTENKRFPGIEKDLEAGMTPTGNIVRDAWVFGIISESETCRGWTYYEMDALYDKVTVAWQPYGHLASNLPKDLRARHLRIYTAAIETARLHHWQPELGDSD
jgi:hypothetical protein